VGSRHASREDVEDGNRRYILPRRVRISTSMSLASSIDSFLDKPLDDAADAVCGEGSRSRGRS